ncbi:MAG: hypothetical protein LBP22_00195 [Deltaproteobacteria bacterium]|nr:hypothetical protein [Deltaproteobacteria bacterium]
MTDPRGLGDFIPQAGFRAAAKLTGLGRTKALRFPSGRMLAERVYVIGPGFPVTRACLPKI